MLMQRPWYQRQKCVPQAPRLDHRVRSHPHDLQRRPVLLPVLVPNRDVLSQWYSVTWFSLSGCLILFTSTCSHLSSNVTENMWNTHLHVLVLWRLMGNTLAKLVQCFCISAVIKKFQLFNTSVLCFRCTLFNLGHKGQISETTQIQCRLGRMVEGLLCF